MTQKDDDFTEELFVGSTHDYMLFMTDQGRVYRLKGYQVPEGSRTAKGTHIVNLLQLQEGEKVTLMLQQAADVDEDNTYATMVTKMGLIKRTPLSQFRNIRKAGLIAIALNEGDSLVWCRHPLYRERRPRYGPYRPRCACHQAARGRLCHWSRCMPSRCQRADHYRRRQGTPQPH